eukprot:3806303-Prymnesium_polylepis.1
MGTKKAEEVFGDGFESDNKRPPAFSSLKSHFSTLRPPYSSALRISQYGRPLPRGPQLLRVAHSCFHVRRALDKWWPQWRTT